MKRIQYFFKPYDTRVETAKHMNFETDKYQFITNQVQLILKKERNMDMYEKRELERYLVEIDEMKQQDRNRSAWKKMQVMLLQKDCGFIAHMKQKLNT